MRAGKAIVCTSIGGNPETVEDGKEALVVPARNSEAIADALVKLIDSESLRKKMGHDARERFLRNFTEDIMKKMCDESYIPEKMKSDFNHLIEERMLILAD